MDAGADDPGYLTDLVEGWRSRCLQGQVPSVELCAALAQAEDDEAERLAFELNLAASEGGTFPPDLAALHFTHGPYTGWSVADLARAFEDPNRDPLELIDLARAVNRAFVGGHDAGVLARWVATPLCGAREVAYGPERARCALLDTECTRGRFVASHGCCIADLAPAGAVCEGGVCGERGTCVRERELRSTARVRGRLAHFELLSGGGSPWPWHVSDSSAIRIARVDDPGPPLGAEPEPPPGQEWQEWESAFGGASGDAIGEIDDVLPEGRRVHLGYSSDVAAIDAPDGALALSLEGEHAEVCAIAGRAIDALGPILSDCSTAGARRLACPGADAGLTCAHEDGRTVVRGEALGLAFAPEGTPSELDDLFTRAFPDRVCAGFGCAQLLDGTLLDFAATIELPSPRPPFRWPRIDPSCDLGGGCRGRIQCFGIPGRPPVCMCVARPEQCNGRDDDCDRSVDEDSHATCDDGVACTIERCVGGGCFDANANFNGELCTPAVCAQGICDGEPPWWIDDSWALTAPDANGCQLALNDAFCADVFDQCACTPPPKCDPGVAAGEGPDAALTGCSQLSPRVSPVLFWPCEISGDLNLCTEELCCEPNEDCRYVRGQRNPLLRIPPSPGAPSTTTILAPDNALCTNQLVSRRLGVPARPGDLAPECVRLEDYASDSDRRELHCNDGNPCTSQVCNATSGACTNPPLATSGRIAARPLSIEFDLGITTLVTQIDQGCQGLAGSGCGELVCNFNPGAAPPCRFSASTSLQCQVCPTTSARGQTADCGGNGPYSAPPGDPCLEDWCDGAGRCLREQPVNAHCDDHLECTVDVCLSSGGFGTCTVSPEIAAGQCLIAGVCWQAGDANPQDSNTPPCERCEPTRSQTSWFRDESERCRLM